MIKIHCVLGVDGGGTKTQAVLVAPDGSVISESVSGASNPQVVGVKQSAEVVFSLIKECSINANLPMSNIQTIVIGLAGTGRISDKSVFIEEFTNLSRKQDVYFNNVLIETDARVALEGAFASSYGIVLIAGTGSIALGKSEDGKIYRTGGWGRILGDEGSGFSIGRKALNLAIRSFEGRLEKTKLLKLALEHFNASSVDDLVTKVYQENADISSFVVKVIQAENEFDHIAHNLLFSQSNELAELVRVLVNQISMRKKIPVALMGGLLETENVYSKMVKERVSRSLPQIIIQKPKFPPAFGAAILGMKAFDFFR